MKLTPTNYDHGQMKKKREFEKIFSRSLPLFAVEYWYQGERIELPKITEKSVFHDLLFIYREGRETDVYYDVTNWDENPWPIPDFFQKHPKKFVDIAKEYRDICRKILKLAKKSKPENFQQIFNLHVSFWARQAVIYGLAERFNEDRNNKIFRQAYELRRKTDNVDYISKNNLNRLAEKSLPLGYKRYVNFLTHKEIIRGKLPMLRKLKKRKGGYIFFNKKIYPGLSINNFKKKEDIVFFADNPMNPKHIVEGTTGAKGKVVGRARIVLSLDKLNKLQEKEILITPMTTPDFFVAMKRAVAFVTDEGGITCHAAIVARELGKPCIIATKIATKVIRSGDLIEVDADRGFVRIMERASQSVDT
ncbi:MAG: PEP-utilizing enzyme [Candidatus Moranbacteria bacterium]|nr:PEP-utilizing enzyme [Candidatus Moranbacteria bacterium]